jgi:hypothetical protein
MVALYTVFYNFIRIHKTVKMSPAMAAGCVGSAMEHGRYRCADGTGRSGKAGVI